jgi:hypothetical protein
VPVPVPVFIPSLLLLVLPLYGDQTLEAKLGFEKHADSCGVSVQSYHADNGIFAEQAFCDKVQASK